MRSAQIIIICALFVFFKTSSAQVIRFNKTIEYQGSFEWGWSVFPDTDSNYIVISGFGDSLDFSRTFWNKFDKYGNVLISNGFYNNYEDHFPGISGSCKISSNNKYYNVGTIQKYNPFDQDIALYKFDEKGDTIFLKTFDVGHQTNLTTGNTAYIATNQDIFLIGRVSDSSFTNYNGAIVRADSSGNIKWSKDYGYNFYDELFDLIEYTEESFFVFGWRGYSGLYGAPWVLKLDSAGNIIQQKWFYNLPNEPKLGGGFGATKGVNNNIVVQGYLDTTTRIFTTPPVDFIFYPAFVGTMDTNMNLSIVYTFEGTNPSRPYIIKQIKDSSYIAVGYKQNDKAGFIAKISPTGQLLWEREYIYKEYGFNYFADFAETPDGGFIITGSTIGDLSQDMWLVKLDSLGLLDDSLIVNNGTVLANSSTNILQLYPNPAKEQLHLKIFFTQKQITTATLMVCDMLGKQIISENIQLQQGKANHSINVSNLPGGNYIAIVQAGGEVVKQRFVRE